MSALLELSGLGRRYAGLVAVDDVTLSVAGGGVHALIGPNGAGKTTLFDLISGLTPPSAGSIRLQGRAVTRLAADRRAALGLARTFQNLRLFTGLSVLENVLAGLHTTLSAGLPAILARRRGMRAEERAAVARARAVLAMVGLSDRAEDAAGVLPYGDQRRLEIARALAPRPALLLLDEPAAGMNPAEKLALAALVRGLPALGTAVLLVEHDMGFVMDLADRVTVLNFGRVIHDGSPTSARSDPAVIEAYLGARIAARLGAGAP